MKTNRRNFVKTLGVGFIGTGLGLSFSEKLLADTFVQNGEITANTKYGKIRGTLMDDVGVFRGIPYSGSAEGQNRFLPPTPVVPWTGIREATSFGPKAYQPYTTWIDPTSVMRETCQYLNIWAPSIKTGKKLPVMFWLHGGGFNAGPSVFDGIDLAKIGDVVVVTSTHRLGLFGYTYLGHFDKRYEQSGNSGMLDILASLQWVRDNIAEFGGDPGNVTIFGQSGGGAKVSTLMAMPIAKGLFHKAVVESGASLQGTAKDDAIITTEMVFKQLGLKPGDINALLAIPAQTIIDKGTPANRRQSPVVDGVILPGDPYNPAALELSADIPLIIGTCKEESGRPPIGDVASMEAIRKIGGDNTDKLLAFYGKNYPEYSLADIFCMLNADAGTRKNSIIIAERKLQKSAPVYMYRFDYGVVPEGGTVRRSHHTGEVPFVFNNPGAVPLTDPGYVDTNENVVALAKKVSSAWAAFAHNANPDHEGIPHWPTYSLTERATMIFDLQCLVVNDPNKEAREILAGM